MMPAIVPYFAAAIFVVFGVGFYLSLVKFREWSRKNGSESDPPAQQ